MSKKKVIIVGAGPGGLTAAMILAHRGFDVEVFEKEEVVGGRNAPLTLQDYTFDTGPTFLMMNFILREMFTETGRKLQDYITAQRLEPMYRLTFRDFTLLPTTDRKKMKEQLAELFPDSAKGYDRFLSFEQKRFEKMFPCLQKPFISILDFLSISPIRALPYFSFGKSMFQKLGDYFTEDDLRLSFTFQSKYLGMSAWECPAAFNIIPYVEHAYGIYHVMGGLNAISHAMKKVVEEEGGTVHLSTPVKQLVIENGRAAGVELESGDICTADETVINADFSYAMTNLCKEKDIKKYTRQKFEKLHYSCSTFMLYLGLDTLYDIPHHNIVFANDYKSNVDDIFHNMRLSTDCSFYIQNPSITDATLAPEGHSALYVLVPVPNNRSGIDWVKEKQSFRDRVFSHIEQRTELHDIRDHIVAEKIITPLQWEQDYNVYRGATFNIGHQWKQMLYFRPRNKFEEFQNCYLTGGGTHPGSGLPTIYESARISANLLCKKYGVPYKKPSILSAKKTLAGEKA